MNVKITTWIGLKKKKYKLTWYRKKLEDTKVVFKELNAEKTFKINAFNFIIEQFFKYSKYTELTIILV